MGQGPFGPPGMGPGDPQRDDYFRRLDEDRFLDSTRSRRDPYPDDYYDQDSAPDPATAKPYSWWIDHHVEEDGLEGMIVHTTFAVHNMRGRTGKARVTFYDWNIKPLKSKNGYYSHNGNLAYEESFTPPYDDTKFTINFFIPYSELDQDIRYVRGRLSIYGATGQILGKSDDYEIDPDDHKIYPDVANNYPDD